MCVVCVCVCGCVGGGVDPAPAPQSCPTIAPRRPTAPLNSHSRYTRAMPWRASWWGVRCVLWRASWCGVQCVPWRASWCGVCRVQYLVDGGLALLHQGFGLAVYTNNYISTTSDHTQFQFTQTITLYFRKYALYTLGSRGLLGQYTNQTTWIKRVAGPMYDV